MKMYIFNPITSETRLVSKTNLNSQGVKVNVQRKNILLFNKFDRYGKIGS